MTDELFALLQPVVSAADLELVDVELRSGVLLVTVDRTGGVDLEALTAALDDLDPVPGTYTLEVSSPGVERTLRTPAHFVKAIGETVTVKTRPQVPGDRRLRGELLVADEDGLELAVEGSAEGRMRLAYSDIDRARTVFVWGPEPRPSGRRPRATTQRESGAPTTTQKKTQKKRKQVASP